MKIDRDEQRWLIKRYIAGTLPDNAKKWVEEELKNNVEFERIFTAYQLTLDSLNRQYEERIISEHLESYHSEILENYLETRSLHTKPEEKNRYKFLQDFDRFFHMVLASSKQASVWIALLFITAIGLTIIALYPHQEKLTMVPIIDTGRGFSGAEEELPLVFYDRNPAWFWKKETYKWPADTLRIYSRDLFTISSQHFISIEPADEDNLFYLKIGNKTYRIFRKTEEATPLKSNED